MSQTLIIPTPTKPVGSGRLQRGSNPRDPHQESRALRTELHRPPPPPLSHKISRKNLLIIRQFASALCCFSSLESKMRESEHYLIPRCTSQHGEINKRLPSHNLEYLGERTRGDLVDDALMAKVVERLCTL